MSQTSSSEAADVLSKLMTDHLPVHGLSTSESVRVKITGFVHSVSPSLTISISRPPLDNRGWITVRPFDRPCEFSYDEKRGAPERDRNLAHEFGKSVLVMRFPDRDEALTLFFTI
jgi:hypothetical protein